MIMPAHTSLLVRGFLAKKNRNHASSTVFTGLGLHFRLRIFPLFKTDDTDVGNRFATIEEIKEKSKQDLLAVPKIVFQKCFEDWKKRWHKCIISEGGYFEGTR